MSFTAEATLMNQSLVIGSPTAHWFMSIRKVDGSSDSGFSARNGQPVQNSDVAQYIPNWRALQWNNIRESMLSHSESYAKDVTYKINVAAPPDSNLSHQQVIDEFLKFMGKA